MYWSFLGLIGWLFSSIDICCVPWVLSRTTRKNRFPKEPPFFLLRVSCPFFLAGFLLFAQFSHLEKFTGFRCAGLVFRVM